MPPTTFATSLMTMLLDISHLNLKKEKNNFNANKRAELIYFYLNKWI